MLVFSRLVLDLSQIFTKSAQDLHKILPKLTLGDPLGPLGPILGPLGAESPSRTKNVTSVPPSVSILGGFWRYVGTTLALCCAKVSSKRQSWAKLNPFAKDGPRKTARSRSSGVYGNSEFSCYLVKNGTFKKSGGTEESRKTSNPGKTGHPRDWGVHRN